MTTPNAAYSPSKRFFHQDGCFYQLTDEIAPSAPSDAQNRHLWRMIECYLPSATGTYGEPLEATMHRLFGYLETGKLKIKRAHEARNRKYEMVDGVLKSI